MPQKYSVTHDSTLLNCLFEMFPDQSRTGVKAYLKNERVLVNGTSCTAFDFPLRKGDTIEILSKGASIGREMRQTATRSVEHNGVHILYEDDHVIVVDKAPGIPTTAHRTASGKFVRSAVSMLNEYVRTGKKADIKAGTGSYNAPSRVFTVHRLESDPSGLILFAKDEYTKNLLQSKWAELVPEYEYASSTDSRGRLFLHVHTLVLRNPYGSRIQSFSSPVPSSFGKRN